MDSKDQIQFRGSVYRWEAAEKKLLAAPGRVVVDRDDIGSVHETTDGCGVVTKSGVVYNSKTPFDEMFRLYTEGSGLQHTEEILAESPELSATAEVAKNRPR